MYNVEYNPEKMARACKRNVPISHKFAREIGKEIKGKKLEKAKRYLEEVIEMKRPVPITRYNSDLAHKPGVGPGRYPVNTAKEILDLLNSVEKNAQNKGLDVKNLYIVSFLVMKGSKFFRPRRRDMAGQRRKNTHISVVVEERK